MSGPPECQEPDCEENAVGETFWTYCSLHDRSGDLARFPVE